MLCVWHCNNNNNNSSSSSSNNNNSATMSRLISSCIFPRYPLILFMFLPVVHALSLALLLSLVRARTRARSHTLARLYVCVCASVCVCVCMWARARALSLCAFSLCVQSLRSEHVTNEETAAGKNSHSNITTIKSRYSQTSAVPWLNSCNITVNARTLRNTLGHECETIAIHERLC